VREQVERLKDDPDPAADLIDVEPATRDQRRPVAVEDVADEVKLLALVLLEELDDPRGLAAGRTEMEVR